MGKDHRIKQHKWYCYECLLQPIKSRKQMKPSLWLKVGESLTVGDSQRCCLHKQGRAVWVWLRAAPAEMIMRLEFESLRRPAAELQTAILRSRFWPLQGLAWQDPFGRYPEGQRGSRDLVDQGQPLGAQGRTVALCREFSRHDRMALGMNRACALKEFTEREAGRGYLEGYGDIACS